MQQQTASAVEIVKRDDEVLEVVAGDDNALAVIHRLFGAGSAAHAMEHEGYSVSEITADVRWGYEGPTPEEFEDSNAWTVTLHYEGREMETPFFTGSAIAEPPDARTVLECLLADSHGAGEAFEDWASDLGYDPDSRKAEATYRAVAEQTQHLSAFLAGDLEAIREGFESR